MPSCIYCGGEVEFRYVDGRCVPIHLSGGCGSGSATGGAGSGAYSDSGFSYSRRFADICHPTTCPQCRAEVHFIRHNGGSVWVDELGWPWPKHACFDEPHERISYSHATSLVSLTTAAAGQALALVNRVSRVGSSVGPRVQIGCLDGSLIAARGRPEFDYCQLLGELVVFSREAGLLTHARLGKFPITILPDSEVEDDVPPLRFHRETELETKCQLCRRYYYEDEKDEHMRRCPRKLPPAPRRTQRPEEQSARLEPFAEPVACPKCHCWLDATNLPGHLELCKGPGTKKPRTS